MGFIPYTIWNWCAFVFCWKQVLRSLYHRSTDSSGVDTWYTSSTTTNECEVHLYHLFVALLPRYQAAQQRPKWPIGPIAWPRLFWAGPKWPIGPMLWPTCVEFVPCNITVHHSNSGTTGVLQVQVPGESLYRKLQWTTAVPPPSSCPTHLLTQPSKGWDTLSAQSSSFYHSEDHQVSHP